MTMGTTIIILIIVTVLIAAALTLPSHRFPYHDYDAHGDKMPFVKRDHRNERD